MMSFTGLARLLAAATMLSGASWMFYSATSGQVDTSAMVRQEAWQPDLQGIPASAGLAAGIPLTPQTLARPLFSPTRRLAAAPATSTPEPEPLDAQMEPEPELEIISTEFSLKGILVMPDGARALVGTPAHPVVYGSRQEKY